MLTPHHLHLLYFLQDIEESPSLLWHNSLEETGDGYGRCIVPTKQLSDSSFPHALQSNRDFHHSSDSNHHLFINFSLTHHREHLLRFLLLNTAYPFLLLHSPRLVLVQETHHYFFNTQSYPLYNSMIASTTLAAFATLTAFATLATRFWLCCNFKIIVFHPIPITDQFTPSWILTAASHRESNRSINYSFPFFLHFIPILHCIFAVAR